MKKNNTPPDIEAKVLFNSDRTCCICRIKNKNIQIHHIDSNRLNNDIKNLAVLCFDCHNDTQISGGFHRKLSQEQVILYRDDWVLLITQKRAKSLIDGTKLSKSSSDIEMVTTTLEALRENKQYFLLAIHYDTIGNIELRDKYIQKALKQDKSEELEIFLRSLQGKINLVDKRRIAKEIKRMTKNKDWSQLGRLYVDIKDWNNAIICYCKSIIEDLQKGDIFPAAYYLKELNEEELHKPLFERAYRKFSEKKELWWQVRALEELGWSSELRNLIISKKNEIEKSGNLELKKILYAFTKEREKLLKINKLIASSTRL